MEAEGPSSEWIRSKVVWYLVKVPVPQHSGSMGRVTTVSALKAGHIVAGYWFRFPGSLSIIKELKRNDVVFVN